MKLVDEIVSLNLLLESCVVGAREGVAQEHAVLRQSSLRCGTARGRVPGPPLCEPHWQGGLPLALFFAELRQLY